MARKKIDPGDRVEVTLSGRERELVLEHTFAGPDLTGGLASAQQSGGKFVVHYTLDELDELLGYIAAEANHCRSKKLETELDNLFERLQRLMESYDDGQWQTAF